MGLFDGSAQPGIDGSSARVNIAIGALVVLVVDAAAISGSIAALVHEFSTWRKDLAIAGVILNADGGSPETFASQLSENRVLLEDI